MTTDTLQNFINLSASLTGFSPDRLNPPLAPNTNGKTYFTMMMENMASETKGMMAICVETLKGQPLSQVLAQQVADAIAKEKSMYVASLALMRLWYLGAWFNPQDPTPTCPENEYFPFLFIPSDNTYIKSVVWTSAQTQAMGYSQQSFGYWNSEPPSLEAAIGKWPNE